MSRAEAVIERLHGLYPKLIDLSLERLEALLAKLGHPERRLPPVIHVAGTNGKGSTCAFLRAIGEQAGLRVHVYTSPHLVHFRERIRLAGELVSDEALSAVIEQVAVVNDGAAITVFEVLVAASFELFARTPAELCILEVGLGGRADATNVIPPPRVCAITSISLDHQDFLGDTLALIAREKAGIMKPGTPVVVGAQPDEVTRGLLHHAASVGAPVLLRGRDWDVARDGEGLRFADAAGSVALPPPSLLGGHQLDNAGIAVAAARASGLVGDAALAGVARAEWPGRLQLLRGRVAALLPEDWELWLDGAHNEGAGRALAAHLAGWSDRPLHLVVGMKQAKDAGAFLRPLLPLASSVHAVAEPGQYLALSVDAVVAASGGVARPGPTVAEALQAVAAQAGAPGRVLVCGSLYLAGEVLKADA